MSIFKSLKVKFNNDFKPSQNSEFIEGSALIAYVGENRNGSFISEEVFEDAMNSLPLIPIVGNWIESKNNFGGHDIIIEKSGTGLVFKDNTVPYGVVKENHNAQWIEIEEDGIIHKYLQADVILWAGRYQTPVNKIITEGAHQSMEVNVSDYSITDDNYLQINKMEFSALCILGKDVDEDGNFGEDNVEPCFESASIIVKTEEFSKNLDALKFALDGKDEVNTKIDATGVVEDDSTSENQDNFDNQDNVQESQATPETDVQNQEPKTESKFMLNSEKREKLREAIPRQESTDDVDYWYWVMDFDETYVYFEEEMSTDSSWECKYYRCAYVVSEDDEITVDANSKEEIEKIWVTKAEADKIQSERETQIMSLESKVDELTKDLESYKVNLAEKDKDIKELQAYKNDVETQIKEAKVEELIEEFAETLKDNEEFAELTKKAMEFEIANLEKELYALEGKVKHQKKNKKEKKSNFSSVVVIPNDDVVDVEDEKLKKIKETYGEASKYFVK